MPFTSKFLVAVTNTAAPEATVEWRTRAKRKEGGVYTGTRNEDQEKNGKN